MKKFLLLISTIVLVASCDWFDNRIVVARESVKEKNENLPHKLMAQMVGFQKTDGESFESKIFLEPGVHKIYKLYYTAEYKADIDGYIMEDNNGSAHPRIFNADEIKDQFAVGQRYGYTVQKEIKTGESFYIKSYVLLRKKESGWQQIDE